MWLFSLGICVELLLFVLVKLEINDAENSWFSEDDPAVDQYLTSTVQNVNV